MRSGPWGLMWPADAVELLTEQWDEGVSATLIATALTERYGRDVTRNAVIGKVHRLKLPRRRPERIAKSEPKRRVAKPKPIQPPKIEGLAPIEPPTIVDLEIPLEQRKTLVELENHHCRFPVGEVGDPDFFFCGGPADVDGGTPYCPAHTARVTGAPPRGGRFYLPAWMRRGTARSPEHRNA